MEVVKLTHDMFKSGQPIAQGEARIWLKQYAPKSVLDKLGKLKNLQELKLENGMLIVAHSESGHHHVLEPVAKNMPISQAAKLLIDDTNALIGELQIANDCYLLHQRGHDTHKAFLLPAGTYVRSLDEETSPEGWRRVAD
jgi:hypothetical protein